MTNYIDEKRKKKNGFWKKKLPINAFRLNIYNRWIFLMSGGGSKDPNIFNEEIYNFRRIRVAPILVVFGFIIEVYAIMKNPK